MVKQYFQAILNKTQIEELGMECGFRDLLLLEKFIMDFEVYGHIKKVIQDCVVKGGMAVLFHPQDGHCKPGFFTKLPLDVNFQHIDKSNIRYR